MIRLCIFIQPFAASNILSEFLHRTLHAIISEVAARHRTPLRLPESAVIHSQLAAVHFLAVKDLQPLGGALNVNKICVRETSWLAGAPVDGNPDVEDIADITEELVEIGIGQLVGEVTDEERLGRAAFPLWRWMPRRMDLVVHDQPSALVYALILRRNGSSGLLNCFELKKSESIISSA